MSSRSVALLAAVFLIIGGRQRVGAPVPRFVKPFSPLAGTISGLTVVVQVGMPLLYISAAGVAMALFYTADPLALKYLGLGDVCIFLAFGESREQESANGTVTHRLPARRPPPHVRHVDGGDGVPRARPSRRAHVPAHRARHGCDRPRQQHTGHSRRQVRGATRLAQLPMPGSSSRSASSRRAAGARTLAMALGFDRSYTLYLAELASAFVLSPLVSRTPSTWLSWRRPSCSAHL